ncbi:MAG: hypothetical protein IJ590_04555 [Rickettsiales bacterium]|nr:hypothetical protein [Rickettsiales bacterium]
MEEFGGTLNEQLNLVCEYNNDEENEAKYKTFDNFLKAKRTELISELQILRKKRIEKKGGDLLKRCAIVQKLTAIDDYFSTKNICNRVSNDQIIYADKSFYYGM